jgi:uncharacterized protein YndB with AHSA1/START domain
MHLEMDIDATPLEVFDLYVDPDRRSEWNPTARSVEIEAGVINEAGSRYRVDTRYGQLTVDVLEVDRPHLYRLRERFGSSDSTVTIRFEARADGGCRVVADVAYERTGRFARLLGPLAEVGGRWWSRRELKRLKAVAERYHAH